MSVPTLLTKTKPPSAKPEDTCNSVQYKICIWDLIEQFSYYMPVESARGGFQL